MGTLSDHLHVPRATISIHFLSERNMQPKQEKVPAGVAQC